MTARTRRSTDRTRAILRRIEARRAAKTIEEYWSGSITATYAEKIKRGNYTVVDIDERTNDKARADAADEELIARFNAGPA